MAEIKIKPKLAHRLYDIEEVVCLELETNSAEIRSYQELVCQCESRKDFALAEQMRGILRNEQQHQKNQAAALAKDLTDVRTFL
jgi:bacterioferritin